jgi:nicotinamidase-related amidase
MAKSRRSTRLMRHAADRPPERPVPNHQRYAYAQAATHAALAKMATLSKLPVITTASVPQGPNGPVIPEIHQNAPPAKYVPRKGEISAWDNPDFVAAVNEGYRVFAVIDASGTYSKMAAVASELQKTWHREDAGQWAESYTKIFPEHQLLIESYGKAQEVVTKNEVLDSQR